jgi:deoxycytidylate deaminase
MSVGEFGRTVHAEMAALLDAARRGAAVEKKLLFTTTFPCHNCTKHIITAGIRKVIYIEPFPKSQASRLHGDAIALVPTQDGICFEPFIGIAPRRYFDLFEMRDRENADGTVVEWNRVSASPRFAGRGFVPVHLEAEETALQTCRIRLEEAGLLPEG